MEKKDRERRTGLIKLRVSEAELETIQRHLHRSTDRSLSQYMRKLALNQPVTVNIRNASADDSLRNMLPLRAALEEATASYTLAVRRLQGLQTIPEVRAWLLLHETTRKNLLHQVSRIESLTLQLYEQWLRK